MWRKRKEITGVSASSIVGLRAEVAKTEQESKKFKASGEKRPKVLTKKAKELLTVKASNKGVKERNKRDIETQDKDTKTWEVAEARLREKSELYDRMVKGESLPASGNSPFEEDRAPLVDFESKMWNEYDDRTSRSMRSRDMNTESDRQTWEEENEREIKEEDEKRERIRLAENIESRTKKGRERHMVMKERRKQDLELRLKQIKERQHAPVVTGIKTEEGIPSLEDDSESESEDEEVPEESVKEEESEDDSGLSELLKS